MNNTALHFEMEESIYSRNRQNEKMLSIFRKVLLVILGVGILICVFVMGVEYRRSAEPDKLNLSKKEETNNIGINGTIDLTKMNYYNIDNLSNETDRAEEANESKGTCTTLENGFEFEWPRQKSSDILRNAELHDPKGVKFDFKTERGNEARCKKCPKWIKVFIGIVSGSSVSLDLYKCRTAVNGSLTIDPLQRTFEFVQSFQLIPNECFDKNKGNTTEVKVSYNTTVHAFHALIPNLTSYCNGARNREMVQQISDEISILSYFFGLGKVTTHQINVTFEKDGKEGFGSSKISATFIPEFEKDTVYKVEKMFQAFDKKRSEVCDCKTEEVDEFSPSVKECSLDYTRDGIWKFLDLKCEK